MKQFIIFFSVFSLLVSCGGNAERQFSDDVQPDDSAQLRIAVMPTLDCLPLYVADACGIFEENGLDVSLLPYTAQMDCDTAFERGRANAVVSDLVRTEMMKDKGLDLRYVTATDASWQLLTNYTSRIKQLKQLDDKMLAMTRFSATHYLSDKAVDSAHLKTARVFRIQVNDVGVRLGMLQTGIMDALLLPEPQATAARNEKALVLMDTRQIDYRLGVVAFSRRAATERQLSAFKKSYDLACDSINDQGVKYYSNLIIKRCGVDRATVDSLPDIQFNHSQEPRKVDIERAAAWLKLQKGKKDVDEQGL
ncbi:MAG: ABC transporter substrate-binding protein [Prevotella sp.]|nr:ABC transporter substrate-binding protein [Prevotella sp.]